jgi:hypothetical protein
MHKVRAHFSVDQCQIGDRSHSNLCPLDNSGLQPFSFAIHAAFLSSRSFPRSSVPFSRFRSFLLSLRWAQFLIDPSQRPVSAPHPLEYHGIPHPVRLLVHSLSLDLPGYLWSWPILFDSSDDLPPSQKLNDVSRHSLHLSIP